MKAIRLCPNCGGPLPPDAPDGLCPQCLLKSDVPTQLADADSKLRAEPVPGQLFGGYRILRLLGQGGMGSVYEAETIENGRRVALKILRHAPDSPTARQRFLREGRLAASVNHPNSVYIYGAEEIDGAPVITMEYVPGGTLSERVKQHGPMPVPEAVDTILQIIAGLEGAAAKGVLHRDVKPSNCFVEADGTVKVGDFGLSISTLARDRTSLTLSGAIMGTPAYASPEQLRGDELDVRADIYSVGVTLYFLLTGKTPFHAENMVNLVATVLEKPAPSPRAMRPEIPKDVEQTVLRCLAKQPAQRFKDYGQLRQALRPFNSIAPTPDTFGLRLGAGVLDILLLALAHLFYELVIAPLGGFDLPTRNLRIALSVLYFAVLEGFWGASVGKWICRLRVVGPNRNPPGFLRALVRALIVFIIPTLPEWLFFSGRNFDHSLRSVLGLSSDFIRALLFASGRRRNGFAALHDLITGTRVIECAADERRPQLTPSSDSIPQTSAAPTVGPFHVLDSLARQGGEEILLGYDPRLLRKVWIRQRPLGTAPTPATQRELTRKGRLHWLASRRSTTECWDAYEAVAGQSLMNLLNKPQPWKSVRFWLHDLAEELDAELKDGSCPSTLQLDRVWITADGRAKLLDFPAPGSSAASAPVTNRFAESASPPSEPTAQRFLHQIAYASLSGCEPSKASGVDAPQIPLPMSAQEFLQALPIAKDLQSVLIQFRPLLDKPAAVSRSRRLALLLGCVLPAFVMLALAWPGSQRIDRAKNDAPTNDAPVMKYKLDWWEFMVLRQSLSRLEKRATGPTNATAAAERNAMEIYLAIRFRSMITNGAFWTNDVVRRSIPPARRQLAEQAVAAHPAPSEAEIREAGTLLKWPLPSSPSAPPTKPATRTSRRLGDSIKAASTLIILIILPSLLFRPGPLLCLLQIEVVTRKGLPAPPWRTFLRCLVAWLPLLLLPFAWSMHSLWPVWILLLVSLGEAAYALVHPERGLQDRVAGTWLVPK